MIVNVWNIYFELRMNDQIEERSSRLLRNLSSCKKKAWKKIQAFFSQLLKLRTNCEDLSSIWFYNVISVVQFFWREKQRKVIKALGLNSCNLITV